MPKKNLYFVAIIPEEPVLSEVQKIKEEAAEQWESKAALKSPPHITLHMPFQWRDDREDQLMQVMSSFSCSEKSFDIALNNYGFFEPRVVFISVVESQPLRALQKEVVTHIRKNLHILNADYKDRGFHPHMTIAFRDLKKSLFPSVKAFYQHKEFSANFHCNSFQLLKHDGKRWNLFQRLDL